jgi:hypothetical protein
MRVDKIGEVGIQGVDTVHVPDVVCTIPDRNIQPATGICLPNLFVGEQW